MLSVKRRIYRNDRLHAACRQSGRKRNRMLLRNTNIEKAVGVHIPEALQSGTVRHGCRNGHHPFIPLPQLAHYRRNTSV